MTFLRTVFLLFALALAGCASKPPAAPSTAATPSPRVLLVSFDGVAFDALTADPASSALGPDGWARIAREGATARLLPVSPTLTSVTHVSMATGALPSETGIVSNTLHLPATPADATVSGFEAGIEAETIWETARRNGKRVGVITYPGVDGTSPARTADFGLIYTDPVSRSTLQTLAASDFSDASIDGSFSTPRAARLAWKWKADGREISEPIEIVAIDTTNDGATNYDDFVVRHGATAFDVGEDRWFPLSIAIDEDGSPHLFGAWSRIVSFDPSLDRVVLYWGSVSRNQGYPESFRRLIDERVGFWPGPPDEFNAGRWLRDRSGIEPQMFVDQVHRFSRFFTRATQIAAESMEWDLILAYQPIVDETEHQWRLVSPAQQWSTPGNVEAAANVRRAAYAAFDEAIAALVEMTPPGATLLVVSDHGLTALHTGVRVNRMLEQWGLATLERGRPSRESRWAAYSSGGYANLHRFGPETPGETETIARRLEEVTAPDGTRVFERVRVVAPGENPRLGQIEAYLRPGYAFISGSGEIFEKTPYFGQHGYLAHHQELHAIFGAWGAAVAKPFPQALDQTEVAPWIARVLGIPAPGR
ncbi:MAG TPA: alkaline phosphatase family protein [Thermoanaerobaculia bacterium]